MGLELEDDAELVKKKKRIVELLVRHGAKRKAAASDFWSAARGGDLEALGHFLETGTRPNERDMFGSTALHWAAAVGQLDAVKFLLAKGARPDLVNYHSESTLDIAEQEFTAEKARSFRHFFGLRLEPPTVNANRASIAKLLRELRGTSIAERAGAAAAKSGANLP